MINYLILNINYNGINEVDHWLSEREFAPIFYGGCTIAQIKNNQQHGLTRLQYTDAKLFVDTFQSVNNDAIVFSIGDEYVYFYKQAAQLEELETRDNNLIKAFKIKLIKKEKIKFCPLILVSIKASRYIASGTIKSLSHTRYLGNTKALDYLIGGKPVKVSSFVEYLQCLSSIEFETLIAKFLEESGLFVPAYKGGFIRHYDLFCRNITEKNIEADKILVKPKDTISVQIKLHLTREHQRQHAVDHFFCIYSDVTADNVHDHEYLRRNLEYTPLTKKWLGNTLYWVNKIM